jgi:cobalt-zinc-cadmium efflux system outer membrane protein
MIETRSRYRPLWPGRGVCLAGLLFASVVAVAGGADPVPEKLPAPKPVARADALPPRLPLDLAVRWALENNPDLAAVRQQHGIAAAGVVIARTYPFNPAWESTVQSAGGPTSAGITNRVPFEDIVTLELEVRGQGTYRRQQASATLSRTDWEIATQEQALAVRVLRAFSSVLYRQEKLRLINETIQVNQEFVERAEQLFKDAPGKISAADLIVARTEIAAARALVGPGRGNLTTARSELRRALGVVDGAFELDGTLEQAVPAWDGAVLTRTALVRRADLRARQAAQAEAEAHLRLTVADRYGNPSIGPAFAYDNTRTYSIGARMNVPLPVFNTHRGDIFQRQAEVGQAVLQVRQTEVTVRQDVQAALARLSVARSAEEIYRTQLLPGLEADLARVEKLFLAAQPGADVLRVIDIRRKVLTARDAYIDALFEVSQALADVVAAVGEPGLVLGPCPPPLPAGPCALMLKGTPLPPAPAAREEPLPPGMVCLPAIRLAPRPPVALPKP